MRKIQLTAYYNRLWKESLQRIEGKGFDFDPLIDSESDNRYGITLLIRPNQKIKDSMQGFIQEIKKIEPDHHFYPSSDIHVTVMPIISCYEGFQLEKIEVQKYIDLLFYAIEGNATFELCFRGVTASPSCIMIKGFPSDDSLEQIRNKLRSTFKNSPLEQSLDKRYPLQTAHSTVIRFKDQVSNTRKILAQLHQYRDYDFGKNQVDRMELVFNDWYQRERFVKTLSIYPLGK